MADRVANVYKLTRDGDASVSFYLWLPIAHWLRYSCYVQFDLQHSFVHSCTRLTRGIEIRIRERQTEWSVICISRNRSLGLICGSSFMKHYSSILVKKCGQIHCIKISKYSTICNYRFSRLKNAASLNERFKLRETSNLPWSKRSIKRKNRQPSRRIPTINYFVLSLSRQLARTVAITSLITKIFPFESLSLLTDQLFQSIADDPTIFRFDSIHICFARQWHAITRNLHVGVVVQSRVNGENCWNSIWNIDLLFSRWQMSWRTYAAETNRHFRQSTLEIVWH